MEHNEITEQLEKIEALRKAYEIECSDGFVNSTDSIRAFHEWHMAAVEFFCEVLGEEDQLLQKFQSEDVSGNGIDLQNAYHALLATYAILKVKVKKISKQSEIQDMALREENDSSKDMNKPKKIFISHASKDKKFTHALILLLNTLGFGEDDIFCSSEPGYWIKKGDFFRVIKEQFEQNDLYVIFIQSPRFYASSVSLNEMGAAWALHSEYYSFLTKDMEYDQMNAVVNNHEIACKVDNDDAKGRLNDWMVELLSYFGKQPIRDFSIWESSRDAFLKTVRRLSYKKVKQSPESTEQSTAKPALIKKDVFIYKKNGETVILTRILNSKQLDVIKVDTTSHDLGIQSEYAWLKKFYPKFKHPMQHLSMLETEQGEKVFDMLPITNGETSKKIYFDITSFFKEPIEILMNENERTTYKIQKLYRKNSEVCSGK